MVLAELGGSIARALARMKGATVVDEKVLADCLNELSRALLQADVRFETVRDVKAGIKSTVNLDALAGHRQAPHHTQGALHIFPIENDPSRALNP